MCNMYSKHLSNLKHLPFRGLQPCQPWKALNHGLQLITATPLPKIKKINRLFYVFAQPSLFLDNDNVLKSIGKLKIKPILALKIQSCHFYKSATFGKLF